MTKKRKIDDDIQVELVRGSVKSGAVHVQRSSTARVVVFEGGETGRMSTRQEVRERVVEVPLHPPTVHRQVPAVDETILDNDGMPPLTEDDFVNDDDSNPALPTSFDTNLPTDAEQAETPMEKKRQRVKQLYEWLPYRQSYLEELLRDDGRGDSVNDDACHGCSKVERLYRCRDCAGGRHLCGECMVDAHAFNPLHKIQVWNDSFWERATLLDIGFVFHLGHGGERCPVAEPVPSPVVVVHSNGVHNVRVTWCRCGAASSEARQLRNQFLRMRWFPATQDRPGTVFSFDVLDLFHELSVQGKISAHDFYHGVIHLVDNAGLIEIHKRYDEFLRVSRYYRHLILLKRAGRGHDPCGVGATQKGELALDCPSCPLPGKNIPVNWMDAPIAQLWLYMLILAIDANFRLKRKERGVKDDPALGGGWSQFVDDVLYDAELGKHHGDYEPNSCDSSFQAIERATMKAKDGYAVTGVGAVICARSGILRPNGVGDLQRGERYANMDFIFLSSIACALATWVLVSYDIACQWSKNLEARVATFPESLQQGFNRVNKWVFAVPKFHLPAHGSACQSVFSLNYLRHTARTDGEGIERGWSHINPVATSTREMGPGFRHDTLDAHWSALNWRKITGMGVSLLKKHADAVSYSQLQREAFNEVNASFPESVTAEWSATFDAWLDDPANVDLDPFYEPSSSKTVADVRKELAKEEGSRLGVGTELMHDTSSSSMILRGIELEELQRALANLVRTSSSRPGTVEAAVLEEKRTSLSRKIQRWRVIQAVYMPIVVSLTTSDVPSTDLTYMQDLNLPSSLSQQQRRSLAIVHDLATKECRLRRAQAEDGIAVVKRVLSLRKQVYGFKSSNLVGQRDGTRARVLLASLNDKLDVAVARYRAARNALSALDPDGAWSARFKVLLDEHLTAPGSEDEGLLQPTGIASQSMAPGSAPPQPTSRTGSTPSQHRSKKRPGLGQGKKEVSWIWRMEVIKEGGGDPAPDEIDHGLRTEWAKARARADHWDEEVLLVREEMRRVLQYSLYKSRWWTYQMTRRNGVAGDLSDGLRAYAAKQDALWKALGMKFATMWHKSYVKSGGSIEVWPAEYHITGVDTSDVEVEVEVEVEDEVTTSSHAVS